MRHKDENKSDAIFQATIQLLNEIGFSEISMSKIAKRANVSPSTIYVYFENKEDMLGKLYLNVKKKMSLNLFHGMDTSLSVKVGFELVLKNYVGFVLNHKDEFLFIEQFTNSPLIKNLCLEDNGWMFQTIFDLIEKGKAQQLLKKVDTNMLLTYSYFPIAQLAKQHFKGEFALNQTHIDEMIQMSWDAIKA